MVKLVQVIGDLAVLVFDKVGEASQLVVEVAKALITG